MAYGEEEGTSYLVEPGAGLIFFIVLVLVLAPAGVVTALKGRWGWVVAGLLLAGLPWLVSAWVAPADTSWWARRRARRSGVGAA
ncbi:hypothetical protein [Conexibacter sp. SYSU D00693]|uniref:hypothetical protein n=1 Tax=Conexibacter sp. SYSU D00693 TaxID=2812560 RepID=UPI00196A741F|nr:hypothetical protein [Conexibacter sp. SYSU D00693]